ncbi:MAG: YggS family pyridoxal phosphate enzyme [Gammaproteobacteria bacterium]|jgi:pyridoxal phosphate enzyme (YggS family)|nr:YggS family pyridoxal phosphate enzyme [Gammaproteobacteria bacterium]
MKTIAQNLMTIQANIIVAAERFCRSPHEIKLLAVSKHQPLSAIQQAIAAGQRCFGESYVQEAVAKITALTHEALEWHFIGPIQTNKTRLIAEHFNWVHSLCRLKIAERLNEQRPAHLPPLNVCIQVNVSNEAHKQGVNLVELVKLAQAVQQLPKLKLRGLMMIPALTESLQHDPKPFQLLRETLQWLNKRGFQLDTLSMGMSADYELAIAEGSTVVRIGTELFGKREET